MPKAIIRKEPEIDFKHLNPAWQRFIRFCQEEVRNGTLYEVELQDGLPLMVKEVIGKKKFSQRNN